ncbi:MULTISPECIES: sigma-70 family RNA polymerase sigma factor [Clostridium]|uniref:DNA-directed RNA polymerase specialized sigma subunit n=1 Tax=Clostridium beijerinckii TaxID=1520 RepID=A0AAX0B3V4_CLOBE|nr:MULTISPECIES: sigma-70 family RNA polymerase sigma factor [Clostridium]MBA8937746.1 DNA-directed RNA polymerase specialized sigma subunit [Clostridium beijerinckii]NRT90047.1 DNA-directed RNA polymerase specialized sigma subunit [Clostridium beijerinckii]NRU41638.1 DNA-directed RNA polymerase specialized sigma subunit [Clostridium beijerinckii]NSB00818.1 DNA-directed RNA polymerase specialized sigma subunit [Clostridium beijerinckii]NYC69577.1 DNA-directed RNA polymerase specialized sigma s
MDNTVYRIRKYKELKADIQEIDIKVQELEEEILGVSGQGTEERTGKTYKITSSVEQQAEALMEKKEELYRQQAVKKRELRRIDNALTMLTDEEKEIIQIVLIERKKYWRVEQKLNLSYSRIKQMEYEAIRKMKKYIP